MAPMISKPFSYMAQMIRKSTVLIWLWITGCSLILPTADLLSDVYYLHTTFFYYRWLFLLCLAR